ncbi:glycosyltransferase family 4 protein [Microbacterium sp. P03]|uniref:glycosyltransferase family 4 protein n=1 Tax=Microbacterium sp. P03 TaxID=3366946 RepID=UPI0037474766
MVAKAVQLDVGVPAERSIAEWERRHALGEVPGVWPYGLDGLQAFAHTRAIDLPAPTRVERLRSRAGLGPRVERGTIGITWDENAALRMAIAKPHNPHFSGVIWLTDAAARGRDLGRLPRMLEKCRALWVLSEAQVQPLGLLAQGVPAEYVRFGIDHRFFAEQPYPARPRVVSVGGDRDRDTDTLFRAMSQIQRRRPDVELLVQTTSEIPPPVGVRKVRHIPHLELRDLYASASVVAIATRPNLHVSGMTVSLESMATGRPVVETRTPGMDDYVAHGDTGLLSEPGDPDALAAHVLELLEDPERAREMGRSARRTVETRFTSEQMTATIYDIVQRFS